MVLGGNQDLPLVYGRSGKVGPGVPDEVPEDMLLQVRFRVRGGATQLVQAGEQWPAGVAIPPVHAAVAAPPGSWVRLRGGDLVNEVAQAVYSDFGDWHRT